jgi:peptide/nickel transport system ATP-binding protein
VNDPMPESDTALLSVRDLYLEFHTHDGIVKALDGVSLDVLKGRIMGLVGETGCGKTVLGNAIMGLVPGNAGKVTGGQILVEDLDVLSLSRKEWRALRGRKISMVFQDPFNALNPAYTIGDQIAEAILLHQPVRGRDLVEKRTIRMLEMVGIPSPADYLDSYPHQFSGGMRQRVMIAIALSCDPLLLIADEPTTALDVTIQAQILRLMWDLNQQMGTAVLLISHDLGVISQMCHDVAIMYAGSIVEIAGMERFLENHRHPYSVGLMGAVPRIAHRKDMLATVPGVVPSLINPPQGCRFHPRCAHAMSRCEVEKPSFTTIAPGHKVACFRSSG